MTRERTFTWSDPASVAAQAREGSGLEFLQAIAGRGRPQAAPICACLGFELVDGDHGRAVFELTPAEYHYNPIGSVHGGVLATLCDSATGAAVHSTLRPGEAYASLEIKVSFLRPVGIDTGLLRCEGTVLSRGARVVVSEARLTDGAGKLYAHASSTCLVLAPEAARPR
jgi:uncharacterized protein (TIGR00369 family)